MKIDHRKLNQYQKLEYSLPFYTMRLDTYEARLKKYINAGTRINLAQLKESFKDDFKWSNDLQDPSSNLYILLEAQFKQGKTSDGDPEYDFLDLWIMGVLLCNGDIALKAQTVYDIL